MYSVLFLLFLPTIDTLVIVKIHRNAIYEPQSSCAFIRNASWSNDVSIESCIWECVHEYDCQTAVFYKNEKNCSMFTELCTTGVIQASANTRSSVICYQKQHNPNNTCSSTTTAPTNPPATANFSSNPCLTGRYWDVTGSIVAGDGTPGIGLNQLKNPMGIYVDSNDSLYIADFGNSRIMKYLYGAFNGTVVAGTTGAFGHGLDQFYHPLYLYVDSSQNLYVSDAGNNRVMRWLNGASNGSIVAGSSGSGSSLNQLSQPYGVWLDSSSNVYVVDTNNHRVTKWAWNAASGVVVAGITGSSGNTTNKLYNPVGLFYDGTNQDLYISNQAGHTIMRWFIGDSNGTVIAGVPGAPSSTSDRLNSPFGITLDQWKNVYVADALNNRLQFFCNGNSTGITIAGSGISGSSLLGPVDVKLDSQMNLYVSEYNTHRITKFNKL